jgi:hypothetical protein
VCAVSKPCIQQHTLTCVAWCCCCCCCLVPQVPNIRATRLGLEVECVLSASLTYSSTLGWQSAGEHTSVSPTAATMQTLINQSINVTSVAMKFIEISCRHSLEAGGFVTCQTFAHNRVALPTRIRADGQDCIGDEDGDRAEHHDAALPAVQSCWCRARPVLGLVFFCFDLQGCLSRLCLWSVWLRVQTSPCPKP